MRMANGLNLLPPCVKRLELPLDCRRGETLDQEFADQTECLGRGGPAPHSTKEAVDHALPNIEANVDSRRNRALDKANRVVEQHLVLADMHADRRQACQIAMERRGECISSIVAARPRLN